MKITQIHTLLTTVMGELLGSETVVQEDLSNVVELGKSVVDTDNVDSYVKKLVNHIGKVVFVNRVYSGGVPSLLMDSWEFGSILEKVSTEMPDATENDSYKLENGTDYSPDIFYQPKVSAKFFNNKVTFEIPLSFTEKQVKESFSSKEQLNGFISMLTTSVENSMTVKLDSLIMRTINNMLGETLAASLDPSETGTIDYDQTTVKAVNLLKLFNDEVLSIGPDDVGMLTKERALSDPEFIRYATYMIGLCSDRMGKVSKLFNVGAKERFSPKDLQTLVLLSDFSKASETYLLSDTYNQDKVTLPNHDSVPYWQGSGVKYDFNDVSKVNVKTSSGKEVETTGILGCLFDRDAIGVSNLDRRVTTNYNAKAEFFTNFYKFDAGYYNDLNENFIVFFIA